MNSTIEEILNKVFSDFDKNRSLLSQITTEDIVIPKVNERSGWDSLRFAIELIQQIRNSGETERDNDFLLSPVRDASGNHFDSRLHWDKEMNGEKVTLPTSGDANGAYNIARKGLIMHEHIKLDLIPYISDQEWDIWLADRDMWKKWIKQNEEKLKVKIKKQSKMDNS